MVPRKTIWVNVIAHWFVCNKQFGYISAETQAGIIAVINIVLRVITKGHNLMWTAIAAIGGILLLGFKVGIYFYKEKETNHYDEDKQKWKMLLLVVMLLICPLCSMTCGPPDKDNIGGSGIKSSLMAIEVTIYGLKDMYENLRYGKNKRRILRNEINAEDAKKELIILLWLK